MKSQSPGRNSRRPRRGGSRRRFDTRDDRAESKAPAKKSFWQKVTAFFGSADSSSKPSAPARNGSPKAHAMVRPGRRELRANRSPSK